MQSIVFIGNCQVQALYHLFQRFAWQPGQQALTYVVSYEALDAAAAAEIARADLIVEQVFDVPPKAEIDGLNRSARRVLVPLVGCNFLWPFAGAPRVFNPVRPFLPTGVFPAEAGMSFLDRMIRDGVDPETAVDAFLNEDVATSFDLDRRYELSIDRQRRRDEMTGFDFATLLERHFRDERLFLAVYHPDTRIALELASVTFERLGVAAEDIARLRRATRTTPFPPTELPIHPAVARHFGLRYLPAEPRFGFLNEGPLTFREIALRYMRCEWNEPLEEGIHRVDKGELDAGARLLVRALERSPHSAAGHAALGRARRQSGQAAQAVVALTTAVRLDPDKARTWSDLALARRETGDLDGAEDALRQAVRLDPYDAHFITLLAHLLHARDRLSAAVAIVEEGLAADDRSAKLHLELAFLREAQGDWERAVDSYRAALRLDPRLPAHDRLAAALVRIGAPAAAVRPGVTAARNPEPAARLDMARALRDAGQLAPAVEICREVLASAPGDVGAVLLLGELLDRSGRLAEAAAVLREGCDRHPDHRHLHVTLGDMSLRLGALAAAEQALKKALALHEDGHGYFLLMKTLERQGRSAAAIRAGRRMVRLEPGSPHRHLQLGQVQVAAGAHSRAGVALRRALALAPDDPRFLHELSDLLMQAGLGPDSVQAARAACELAPTEAPLQENLTRKLAQIGAPSQGEPVDFAALVDRAWEAHHRRDWDTALRRWAALRGQFPERAAGYVGAICTLRHSGDLHAAEALAASALRQFPGDPAVAIEHAWNATERRDTAEAEARWQLVRARFPDQWISYVGEATALRYAGRDDPAEDLLRTAIARFPGERAVLAEYARMAAEQRRWDEAALRWTAVCRNFPAVLEGYLNAAFALRQAGRLDDAEGLLSQAIAAFPQDPGPAIEHAWIAHAKRDWDAAVSRWQVIRAGFPGEKAGYAGAASALRELRRYDEAEALLAAAHERAPDDPGILTDQAWLAQIRRDWPEAIRRWARVREREPGSVQPDLQTARVLCELWRHDEAEALLAAAIERFPAASEPAAQFAWIALQQHRPKDAAERFALVRARFPDCEDGWLGGALVLRDQFRLAEAGEMLLEGKRHCPNGPRLMLDYAQLPIAPIHGEEKDWPETLRRMDQLRAEFPDFAPGYSFGIRLLHEVRQPEAAERLAADACRRFPDNAEFAVEHARAAEARGDWAEASRRYARLRDVSPQDPGGDVGLARCLAAAGKRDEAEAALRAAMTRFPHAAAPFAAYAQIAVDRREWREALRRWTDALERFPDQREFAYRLHDASNRVAELELEPERGLADHERLAFAVSQAATKPDPAAVDRHVSHLMMQFESLGGRDLGCEFGMVQRECGAEPLGLLRWADMTYEKLLFALTSRFEGVGTPDHTELFTNAIGGGRPEYCTVDRRGMMFMRAFIYEDEVPFDKMYAAACRRLQFLTRKLIDDLEQGTKIFVFRLTERNLTPEEIDALHAATRGYGDNMLLYLRYEDAAHPNGTVELVKPGLMIGYMDRFKAAPTRELSATPPTASWVAVCRAAYALWVGDDADGARSAIAAVPATA